MSVTSFRAPNACLSLAGCGFLGLYLVGAVEYIQLFRPHILKKVVVAGASAGALLGACLVCDIPPRTLYKSFLCRVQEATNWAIGPFSPGFSIEDYLLEGLKALPADAHLRARGRLHVSMTRVRDGENVLVSEWATREDLIQVLKCSCFIPLFSGFRLPLWRGEKYIDGCFSNNLPVLGRACLTVSPFAGMAHICPEDNMERPVYFTLAEETFTLSRSNISRLFSACFPPTLECLDDLRVAGYADAFTFFNRKLIKG